MLPLPLPPPPPLSQCTRQITSPEPISPSSNSAAQIGFLEVSIPRSWMTRITCGNLKLWIFLMLPTVLLKHKLLCGLMKYISMPQNYFGCSKTQNESWVTSATLGWYLGGNVLLVDKMLNLHVTTSFYTLVSRCRLEAELGLKVCSQTACSIWPNPKYIIKFSIIYDKGKHQIERLEPAIDWHFNLKYDTSFI